MQFFSPANADFKSDNTVNVYCKLIWSKDVIFQLLICPTFYLAVYHLIRVVHNLCQWYPIYQYNVLFGVVEVQWETFEIVLYEPYLQHAYHLLKFDTL